MRLKESMESDMAGQKRKNHDQDRHDRIVTKTAIKGKIQKEVCFRFDVFQLFTARLSIYKMMGYPD